MNQLQVRERAGVSTEQLIAEWDANVRPGPCAPALGCRVRSPG